MALAESTKAPAFKGGDGQQWVIRNEGSEIVVDRSVLLSEGRYVRMYGRSV